MITPAVAIDATTGLALRIVIAGAFGEQRGADRGRPQHVAAGGQAPIRVFNDELLLEGAVRLQLGGASADVEPAAPDAHPTSPVVVTGVGPDRPLRVTEAGGRALVFRTTSAPLLPAYSKLRQPPWSCLPSAAGALWLRALALVKARSTPAATRALDGTIAVQ